MSDNIVANWLGSLNLDYYVQAFFDNGYDELEICKQIGDADLNAIGVSKSAHREKILRAVTKLKEEGGTSVYFTLEGSQQSAHEGNISSTDNISTCSSTISYTNSQLLKIIRGRLLSDSVDLASLPYVKTDGSVCDSSIAALAVRYSEELKASSDSVTMAIEELQQCLLTGKSDLFYSATPVSSNSLASLSSEHGCHGYSCRAPQPPPIPTIPPPSSSHVDKTASLHSIPTRYSGKDSMKIYDYVALESGMCCIPKVMSDKQLGDNKRSGTLGKLFRNIGLRRSGRKQGFRQHEGDPNAYEITMSDDDRMALMLMVKEGKITTQHAIEVVKKFEDDRRKEIQQIEKERKKKKSRPVKSPSAVYTDSPKKCGVCLRQIKTDDSTNSRNKCSDPSHRFECFQHRRVHSVSHLESTVRSPDSPRSLSCTPTRTLPSSAVTSPVSFFLPSARVYTPVFPHGHTMECHHRRNVSVHDSTSHTSLLSLESEQSMECQGHTDLVPLRGDEVAYCSNSSAVSMTSENSPQSWNVKPDCYSRLKCCPTDTTKSVSSSYQCCAIDTTKSASSSESNHSGSSGMRSLQSVSPMSGKSSVSMDDNPIVGPSCPMAVMVHTDFTPGKADTDFLKLERGDVIFVLNKTTSGLCWGSVNGRTGWFKASHVEPVEHHTAQGTSQKNKKFKPKSVSELLHKLGLQHLEKMFVQNGFDHLESFFELDEDDLNALHITDQKERTKLLTAADFLSDIVVDHIPNINRYLLYTPPCASQRSASRCSGTLPCPSQRSASQGSGTPPCASQRSASRCSGTPPGASQRSASRDSGCYASWEHIHKRNQLYKTLSNNKENVLPETNKPSIEKVENSYSEEDREVFELIKHNLADDSYHGDSSQKGVVNSYAETLTSLSGSNGANTQASTVMDNKTSQVFTRKNVPRMGSVVRESPVKPGTSADHQSPLVPCYDIPRTINGSVSASPVAGYRQVKKSLVNIVAAKLASEAIDLSQEPYSTQCGTCGIPPLFIQRYSDELKQEITSVAIVLDQIRIHQLKTSRKPVIPAVDITVTCSKACDLDISSVDGFFNSIGLPMYTETIKQQGVISLDSLLNMSDQTLKERTGASSRHVRRISHALDWVQRKISASRDPTLSEDHV